MFTVLLSCLLTKLNGAQVSVSHVHRSYFLSVAGYFIEYKFYLSKTRCHWSNPIGKTSFAYAYLKPRSSYASTLSFLPVIFKVVSGQ